MEHYKIVLSIGEDSIEISSHSKDWVEQKEKYYLDFIQKRETGEKRGSTRKIPSSEERSDSKNIGKIPINEFYRKFIHEKKINSRPDIATFFVYFLTKIENKSEIIAGDIKNLFKDVQYPGWNSLNIADVLNKAKRKAFLNCVSGQWSLTITGEDFVLNIINE